VKDPTGLTIAADYDYISFQPARVTDENGNAMRYAYTPLGLLLHVVLEGREGEGGSDGKPETRYRYDFHAYDRTRDDPEPQPISVHTTQRIWHAADDISDETMETREYSDGFGRLIQTRTQAEEMRFGADGNDAGLLVNGAAVPGQAGGGAIGRREPESVIVSGWQVFDNKGQVVEQYEPFFDTGWDYQPEAEARRGERVATFYDPRGHVIRTLSPDGSETRAIFGVPPDPTEPGTFAPTPWETYSYDANDLAPLSLHPDEKGPDGSPRTLAADAPQAHHFTPTSALLDAQGRAICRVERNGDDPAQDWFVTRFAFDPRGNLLTVRDAMGRAGFRHAYDLLDRPLRVESIDAGTRTTVRDAAGNVVEFRDSKGSLVLRQYDARNHLTHLWARDDAAGTLTLRERLEYGTGSAGHRARNRSGRLYRHFDEAGLVQHDRYDFKGNLIEKRRRTIKDSALAAGWTANWAAAGSQSALEASAAAYGIATRYDALNRPVETIYPREAAGSSQATVTGRYGRGGTLERIEVDGVPYVERIAHNAKGQRLLIVYGNGMMTRYAYDRRTMRLIRLRSERRRAPSPAADEWHGQGAPVQDLTYRYDLAGNLLALEERTPGCGIAGSPEGRNRLTRRFTYDPVYRLTEGTGRACRDLVAPRSVADRRNCGFYPPLAPPVPPAPNQANAPDQTWGYAESYAYDPAGNLLELVFTAPAAPANVRVSRRRFGLGGLPPDEWPDAANNRLTRLWQGQDSFSYTYDANGNLFRENSERQFRWDHDDRLAGFTVRPPGAAQASVEVRYLYGADGARVKKWVRRNGTGPGDSTVYIDGVFEHHRWKKPGQAAQQNNTLHVLDGQGGIALIRRGPAHPDDFGPAVQYHLADHLGSSGVVVDDGGNWVNREEYFPYGETSFGGFARKRYRFTGKERDEESGLTYHGARYYAPWLARWMSCDPDGVQDALNLFLYVRDNSIRYTDSTGRGKHSNDLGQSGQELFAKVLNQLEETFLEQQPYNKGQSIIDFVLENKGKVVKTVDIKTREIPNWIGKKGQLKAGAIKAHELVELEKTLKHMGDTKRPETMLYLLKGGTPEQAERYKEIVRQAHADFFKMNPGIKRPGLGVSTEKKLEQVADQFWQGVKLRRGGEVMRVPKIAGSASKTVTNTSKAASVELENSASAPANLTMAEREILEGETAQTAESVDLLTRILLGLGFGEATDALAGKTDTPAKTQQQQQHDKPRVGEPIDWNKARREQARPKDY
jgi:RHS repeat-associated protein